MAFDISRLITSSLGVRLAFAIGRSFPRRLGYKIADYAAGRLAQKKDVDFIRAMRANQWVVSGETINPQLLNHAVRDTLQHTARSIFDLYHFVDSLDRIDSWIIMDPTTKRLINRSEFDDRGLMVVGLHLSCFDLALQWLCWKGMKPLVLTIPNPQGGRRIEYETRKKIGMNLVPASVTALRQSLQHLQAGGTVLTGIDRPISNPVARPRFFGRPASLPVHHIFLATHARVPIIIMAVNLQEDGKYHLLTSEPIEMEFHANRETQTLLNAEKVLSVAETFIRRAPQQWTMSLPVWPETLTLMPD